MENKVIKVALAGNPNSGKTTLFNALTGSNQFVGNWPGVTVEKKEGSVKGYDNVIVTDLPGVYSLSPYTLEEVVARNYLIDENPDVILNIVDGTNLERNLYLTTQLIEIGIPVVIAVNMMDVVRKSGDKLNLEALGEAFGSPVYEISALKNEGVIEALDGAVKLAREKKASRPMYHIFSGAVEHALAHIEEAAVHGLDQTEQRWYSIKIFERDSAALERLNIDKTLLSHIEDDIKAVEAELDDDAESIIINERYNYIERKLDGIYVNKKVVRQTISDKIDRVVTNRFLALPIFALIMFIVYYVSVTTVGTFMTDFMNEGLFGEGFDFFGIWVNGIPVIVEDFLVSVNCQEWLIGLVVEGIVGGVGAVLGFVPQMLVLFTFLSFLEASGYMSRIAFVMDRLFVKFGLSGKSFIPMLIGTGCSVPGIMASRTIENESDRRMTVITTSFIPCGAKLPVIALVAAAFFGNSALVALSAYIIGVASVIISGIILKKTKAFSGEPSPFVLELPAYHMPTLKNLMSTVWERGWSFIKKAGTVILLSSMIIWAGSKLGFVDGVFTYSADMELENSIIGAIGSVISYVFIPLGFGNIKATVATIMGLLAKEEIVAVFGILDFSGITAIGAYSFLVFNLLCAPCFAAMGAIKREMNSAKWTAFAIIYQCVYAYLVAFVVYQLGTLFSGVVNLPTIIGSVIALGIIALFVYLIVRPNKYQTKRTGVKND